MDCDNTEHLYITFYSQAFITIIPTDHRYQTRVEAFDPHHMRVELTFQVNGHEIKGNASSCQERTLNLGDLWVALAEMCQNGPISLGLHQRHIFSQATSQCKVDQYCARPVLWQLCRAELITLHCNTF